MKFKTLDRSKAKDAMEEWRNLFRLYNGEKLPDVNEDYLIIRKKLTQFFNEAEVELVGSKKEKYNFDVSMGVKLYEYLNSLDGFNIRVASNDEFWYYLSLKVAPDLVTKRYNEHSDEHFYKKNVRVWFSTLWWYIHLSWQGDLESTKKLLLEDRFNTDTILNLAERPGRNGTYIDIDREIMKTYGTLNDVQFEKARSRVGGVNNVFRLLMHLHTAKSIVLEPLLYDGGINGYVTSLFKDAQIEM